MAENVIQCAACGWSDTRSATTRPPATCPNCGADAMVPGDQAPKPAPARKPPARKRTR